MTLVLPKYTFPRDDEHSEGRHYYAGGEWRPSVTTVLKDTADTTGLDEWREWKGAEEADRIAALAAWRGNNLHQEVETFLTTGATPNYWCPFRTPYWDSIYPYLLQIQTSLLCEGAVYHPFNIAGSIDNLSVMCATSPEIDLNDWKTADRPISDLKMYGYMLQVAAYVACAEHTYADFFLRIARANIIVAIPETPYQIKTLDRDELKQLWIHFQARYRYSSFNRTRSTPRRPRTSR